MSYTSKQFAWSDCSIAIGGRIIEGITGFEQTPKQDKEALYGRGNKPHKIVKGNKSYEGKLSLWQSEIEAMTEDAPNKDLLDLEFEVTVVYESASGQIVTDIWKGCEATEVPKGMGQGDKNKIVELPIIFLDLKTQQ